MVSSTYGNYGNGYNYGNYSAQSGAGSYMSSDPVINQINQTVSGANQTYQQALQSLQSGGGTPQKKGLFGKIGDFFKGIVQGAVNMVKSLADPKTWLMIAGAAALCFVFPPAGIALMAVGAGMSGWQMLKGFQSGDWTKVGEGALGLGLTFLGARANKGVVKGKDGVSYSSQSTRVNQAVSQSDEASAALSSAEKALEKAKAKGVSADELSNLETTMQKAKTVADDAAVNLARAQKTQMRLDVASMPSAQKDVFLAEKATMAEAKSMVSNAKSNLQNAESALAKLKPGDTNYVTAESLVSKTRLELETANGMLKRVEYRDYIQGVQDAGIGGKAKNYLATTWDAAKGNIDAALGRPLSAVDGSPSQISLYNRVPTEAAKTGAAQAKTGSVAGAATVADDAAGAASNSQVQVAGAATEAADTAATNRLQAYKDYLLDNKVATFAQAYTAGNGIGQAVGFAPLGQNGLFG